MCLFPLFKIFNPQVSVGGFYSDLIDNIRVVHDLESSLTQGMRLLDFSVCFCFMRVFHFLFLFELVLFPSAREFELVLLETGKMLSHRGSLNSVLLCVF